MQAKSIQSVTVTSHGKVDGVTYVITDCQDYDAYKALPNAVEFNGMILGKSGWNSDKSIACFQSNVSVAFPR